MKNYTRFGVALLILLGWANHRGWRPFDDLFFASTVFTPAGKPGFHK